MPESYDVIIIGTGAGGGTLANTLASSGKKILLLERGDFLPRERENWDPGEVFINGRYISKDTWYTSNGEAFQPQVHYFVGGATKMYGAALYRLRPQDFGELKHVDGVSPAWPLSYDDFEPYYTKAEWLFQVHGNHGEDPIEGHWSKQYPWPAVSHEPRIQELSDNLGSAGLSPLPRALRDPARRGRPATEHLHPMHVVRRLSLFGAREVRRRDDGRAAGARHAERHAEGALAGGEARDRSERSHGDRRGRGSRR
jgi:choline dehydrogenase-like flavoprotein